MHCLENGAKVIAHCRGHGFFVLSVARTNMQGGNSPRILFLGIELHEVFGAWQALALSFDAEIIRNVFAYAFAPGIAELRQQESVAVKFLAAVAIEAVSTYEFRVTVFRRAGRSIYIFWSQKTAGTSHRLALGGSKSGHASSGAFDGEVIHEVVSEDTVGIADTLGVSRGFRVQQNTRRLECRGGNDDHLCIDLTMLAGIAINGVDTFRAAGGINKDVADDGVADQDELSRTSGCGQCHARTIEIGSGVAAALALVTVMTGGASAMIDGEIGNAVGHDTPAELAFNHFLRGEGTAGEIHRRQELTVWHLR